MSGTNANTAYLAVILCQLSWSSFHALGRYAMQQVSPFVIPMFRSLISVPIVGLLILMKDRSLFHIDRHHIPYLMLLGAVGAGFNQALFIWGLSLSSSASAGISQPIITCVTLLLSVLLKLERITWTKLVGTGISLAGCGLIVGTEYLGSDANETSSIGHDHVIGWIILLIQCCVYASYLILNKPMADKIHWLPLCFYTLLFGGICNIMVGIPFAITSVDWDAVTMYGWASILYIGFFASVFSQLLWNYAQKRLAPSVTSLSILMAPICSSGLGFLLLGETITIYDYFGAALIIAGVTLVIYGRSQEVRPPVHDYTPVSTDNATEVQIVVNDRLPKSKDSSVELSELLHHDNETMYAA